MSGTAADGVLWLIVCCGVENCPDFAFSPSRWINCPLREQKTRQDAKKMPLWRFSVAFRSVGWLSVGMSGTAANGVLGCGGHCPCVAFADVGGLWYFTLCVYTLVWLYCFSIVWTAVCYCLSCWMSAHRVFLVAKKTDNDTVLTVLLAMVSRPLVVALMNDQQSGLSYKEKSVT